MPAGRPRKDAPVRTVKAIKTPEKPGKRQREGLYQPGVIILTPRVTISQYFHAPTEQDRDAMATHILHWLRKKEKYFNIPKKPEPLEFDVKDIASYPQYLRADMHEKAAEFLAKERAHLYWTERVAEIDTLLYDGLYTRSPWQILESVYPKVEFRTYEKIDAVFDIQPAEPQTID